MGVSRGESDIVCGRHFLVREASFPPCPRNASVHGKGVGVDTRYSWEESGCLSPTGPPSRTLVPTLLTLGVSTLGLVVVGPE